MAGVGDQINKDDSKFSAVRTGETSSAYLNTLDPLVDEKTELTSQGKPKDKNTKSKSGSKDDDQAESDDEPLKSYACFNYGINTKFTKLEEIVEQFSTSNGSKEWLEEDLLGHPIDLGQFAFFEPRPEFLAPRKKKQQ